MVPILAQMNGKVKTEQGKVPLRGSRVFRQRAPGLFQSDSRVS